jgi:WD40 repeat protein
MKRVLFLFSIEFDRDDELFATAGVSRCIKVFDFSSVVNEPADMQCPIVEMSTRSKLSCLSWNKHEKNHIASSDYEGIVTVWDVTTRQVSTLPKVSNIAPIRYSSHEFCSVFEFLCKLRQSLMEYEEHEKRAWSVDFSRTEPSMLVSGSDDCKVNISIFSVITFHLTLGYVSYKKNTTFRYLLALITNLVTDLSNFYDELKRHIVKQNWRISYLLISTLCSHESFLLLLKLFFELFFPTWGLVICSPSYIECLLVS